MDLFNTIAGICSILGLIFSIISLFIVSDIRIKINGNALSVKGRNNTIIQNNNLEYNNLVDPELFLRYINAANDIQKGTASERDMQIASESMSFKVENDKGEEIECEVLFTFESEQTAKNYIVYTDNTEDEEGNTKVYASIYNPDQDETKLLPIETDEEWNLIETILDELQNAVAEGIENTDAIMKRINKKLK